MGDMRNMKVTMIDWKNTRKNTEDMDIIKKLLGFE